MGILSMLRQQSAIIFLITQPRDSQIIYTNRYLGAAHEIFVISLALCWAVALIFTPDKIHNHPARDSTWHYNPCFGWDFPPASYIAVLLNSTNVYWTWRYAWLETTRSKMLNASGKVSCFSSFACYNLAAASNVWLLLWIIGPYTLSWGVHTYIFLYYAVASYLAHLGNYLDAAHGPDKHKIERKHKVYLVTYTISLLLVPVVYGLLIATDDFDRKTVPVVPPAVTQAVDIFWLSHMLMEQHFSPPEPPLKMTLTLEKHYDRFEV